MKKLSLSTALLAAALSASPMQAAVIDFDDTDASANFGYLPLASPYQGLSWTYWAFIDGDVYGASGYKNGVVSQNNVGCGCGNDYGSEISYISSDTPFAFNSGYFTSAWKDGATLYVAGYLSGNFVTSLRVGLDTTGPTFVNFGWSGIDELRFSISGGTNPGLPGDGNYFAADNLSFGAVPEPASWALMIGGLGLAGAAMRRRRTAVSFA